MRTFSSAVLALGLFACAAPEPRGSDVGALHCVRRCDGSIAWTRSTSFDRDADGRLTLEGHPVHPAIVVPPEIVRVVVSRDGTVHGFDPVSPELVRPLGHVHAVRFDRPLVAQGSFYVTED